MKPSASHAFINQLLIFSIVAICLGGSVGVGTVWLRNEITLSAQRHKVVQLRIQEVNRRINELTAAIAAEQTPEVLTRKNAVMELGLVRPREPQVVRVPENVEQRLATKRNLERFRERPLFDSTAPVEPPAPGEELISGFSLANRVPGGGR